MREVMIGSSIIILSDELDQPEQVEGLPDHSPLGAGVDDGLGVDRQLLDRVGERREIYFVEVGDGDEGVGLRERDQREAGELALLSDFLFLSEVPVIG